LLPLSEQYRYVAYKPTKDKWNDWSHEREWRWKYNSNEEHQISSMQSFETFDSAPGLPLFLGKENGGDFSTVAIIVWTREEADKIQEMLTGFYFAASNNYCAEFSQAVIAKSKIIILEDVIKAVEADNNLNAQTIEGLSESQLLQPIFIQRDTEAYQSLIEETFSEAATACQAAADQYVLLHPSDIDTCGYANTVTYWSAPRKLNHLL
jgi:hypothetical protein